MIPAAFVLFDEQELARIIHEEMLIRFQSLKVKSVILASGWKRALMFGALDLLFSFNLESLHSTHECHPERSTTRECELLLK